MRHAKRVLVVAALLFVAGCQKSAANLGTPLTTLVERSTWNSPYARGERIESRHYVIFSTAQTGSLQRYFPGFMEAAHQGYLALTGLDDLTGQERLPIYLLGTREEWAALTTKVTGPLAEKYLNIEAGGYCFQGVCVLFDIRPMASFSVGAHEGMHQFLYHGMKHHLPLWLEEGLCATSEGYEINGETVRFTPDQNLLRFNDLRRALVARAWLPIAKLLPLDAGDVLSPGAQQAVGYYGQLWALVRYIRSQPKYNQGLRRLLKDAQDGTLHEALDLPLDAFDALMRQPKLYNRGISEKIFRHYISDDLDAFEQEYHGFAMKIAELH